jgi:hypothetical protein
MRNNFTRKHVDFILLDIYRLLYGFTMNKNPCAVEDDDDYDGDG